MAKAYFQRAWNYLIWGEQRATNLEDPNTTINGKTLTEIFGGTESTSGEVVSYDSAMKFSAVWRATQIISGIIGSLPFKPFEKTTDGREELTASPYYNMLTQRPSPLYTRSVFFQRGINHYLNWGNMIAEIKRTSTPRLELIHPSCLKEIRINTRGNLVYIIDDGGERSIRADNIIHVPNLGDGIIGVGVIGQAKNDIGLEQARSKYGNKYFKDAGRPKAFIATDQILKPAQFLDLGNSINKQIQANGHIVADSGMKYQSITIPPEDAQFLGTGEFNVETIARWYGVPKSKLASSKDPTHSNIENMAIEMMQDTISPILIKIEQEFTTKLFSGNDYCEFDMNAYLRADTMAKAEQYRTGIANGYLTINEVRSKENLNPVDNGNRPIVQGAMIHLDKLDDNNFNNGE